MLPISALLNLLGQLINRLIGLLDHRRYHHTLQRGAVEEERVREARATWWGNEPIWYPGGTPPRQHNRLTPLVHGEAFFAALREALAQARDYVYVVGWCLTPGIPLGRADDQDVIATRLHDLLGEVARRAPVRVLLWSGAPILVQPTRRTMLAAQRLLLERAGGDLECRLDETARLGHSHHQKAIVIDGQVAFVGGMDLTTFHGDRWDRTAHPLRVGPNWHDVQVRLEGEAVADVEHNFRQRWLDSGGDDNLPHRLPSFQPDWQTPMQVVRTIPARVYRSVPRGEFGIHHAYTELLTRARRLIYLENQYLWSPDIMDVLLRVIATPRTEPLRIVLVLPAHATDGKWDNDYHVAQLRAADQGRGIVSVHCLYTSGIDVGMNPFMYRPTYVHAKVGIVDDEWLTIGSANLNGRGMVTDSEINVLVHDPTLARNLRVELWAEHLRLPADQVAQADPIALVDREWTQRSAENAAIIERGDRLLVCGIVPYQSGHMAGSEFLEGIELLTFDR